MSRKVIGEGSYGCVQQPSIPCETSPDTNFNYDEYVSKLMKNKDAQKELSQFIVIGNYDTSNEYHLGTPILCKPELTKDVMDDIGKCKYFKKTDIVDNPDDFSLLLLKYGGPDLSVFCKDHIKNFLKTNKSIKSDNFWLEAQHLLKGLKFFRDNNIVHHDIKPQNILFNLDNGKLMFIDFGLMTTSSDIIEKSKIGNNNLAVFHWSYPFDTGFMDKRIYDYYKNTPNSLSKFRNALVKMIINNNPNVYGIPLKRPDSFKLLFSYIDPKGKEPTNASQFAHIQDFFKGFDKYVNNYTYNEYLQQAAKSIDIFGLGFSLQFILNCFKNNKAVDNNFYTKASALFGKMYDFSPLSRELDIENILNEYENILLETGILTRLNKDFVNHEVVDTSPIPDEIKKEDHTVSIEDLEKNATLNVIELEKLGSQCPEGKELNPRTKRCNKVCKDGYSRNEEFKCKKNTRRKIAETPVKKSKRRKIAVEDIVTISDNIVQ
jgi:serine/threonine protein kinase